MIQISLRYNYNTNLTLFTSLQFTCYLQVTELQQILSVNQLNAQVKLLEVWKALNVQKYPLAIKQQSSTHEGVLTRADNKNRPCEIGMASVTTKTCISDAVRLWNLAPQKIKSCGSPFQAKREIKTFVKSLPV